MKYGKLTPKKKLSWPTVRKSVGSISRMNILQAYLLRPFSPYGKISQVPVEQVQRVLIDLFEQIGMPEFIRVDNGRPFGDPQRKRVPALAMWLICLGVRVIWNKPATPQDNAKVERGQGVLANWVEPHRIADEQALQQKLIEEAHFQRAVYPVQQYNGKTRLEAFPDLAKPGKPYDPENFDLQRVLDFLAKGFWERTISSQGQISHFGQRFQAGYDHRGQKVSVKMDALINHWKVYNQKGQLIKSLPSRITEKSVRTLEKS